MNDSPVIYAVEGAVALVTLNRPEKRNALNDAVVAGLKQALGDADAREDVRAVLVTGAGADFCSGADLSALKKISESSVAENLEDAQELMELFALIRRVRVPVVAAVRGRALAGGCGLATACDIVLASSSARFGYPEVKIGFVPAMVMAILRRNVSEKRAFELVTRGAEISAAEAERAGLINHVFDDDAFEAKVERYVAEFEPLSRTAVALTKRLLLQPAGRRHQRQPCVPPGRCRVPAGRAQAGTARRALRPCPEARGGDGNPPGGRRRQHHRAHDGRLPGRHRALPDEAKIEADQPARDRQSQHARHSKSTAAFHHSKKRLTGARPLPGTSLMNLAAYCIVIAVKEDERRCTVRHAARLWRRA